MDNEFRAVPEPVYPQETAAENPFPSRLNARLQEAPKFFSFRDDFQGVGIRRG